MKPSHSGVLNHYGAEFILILAWLIVQSLIFYRFGIVTDFEAVKYINEAKNLLENGTLSSPNFWMYSTQIFLIATAIKFNSGFLSVVIIQLILNIIATYVFYKFIQKSANKTAAFILTLLLICNYPFQTFNTALQTESIFFSLSIIFSCYLLQLKKITLKNLSLVFLFIILIIFTRPTGLYFVPATALYLFFHFFRSFPVFLKLGIIVLISATFLYFLNAAIGSGGELDFMLPFRDESIICGVPALSYTHDIKVSENPNSIYGLIYYITHNFTQFIHLAWLRSKAFWGLFRSYFSLGHNLYLGLYFFPVYLLVLLSIREWCHKNRHTFLYCLSLVLITWAGVILTCDDWHNRFLLGMMPFIYILSIPALKRITDKYA
ncbi:MAG: glycosyltransferase family 39 protein [Chitinophagaceae bacterium]|jgi:hypothetical protein|nr:glycosyltransferase family 39 protein [Chitinophagaceae bacterium]